MRSTALILAFQDPPRDAIGQHPIALLITCIVGAVVATVVGAVWAYRNRSAMWLVTFLACSTVFPFFGEPFGDRFLNVWFPLNHPIAITVLGRPMPWFGICFYIAVFPAAIVLAYELAKRVPPAKTLIYVGGVFGVAEVALEAYGNHMGWIIYYGNPATILGIPIYCLAQNGGVFIFAGWACAVILPRTHGWRWALFPFTLFGLTGAYVLTTTWPAYLALAVNATAPIIWAAAITSTILNAAAVTWCAYSPQLKRLRQEHANAPETTGSTQTNHAGVS